MTCPMGSFVILAEMMVLGTPFERRLTAFGQNIRKQ
jgi:hypothetical protein